MFLRTDDHRRVSAFFEMKTCEALSAARPPVFTPQKKRPLTGALAQANIALAALTPHRHQSTDP